MKCKFITVLLAETKNTTALFPAASLTSNISLEFKDCLYHKYANLAITDLLSGGPYLVCRRWGSKLCGNHDYVICCQVLAAQLCDDGLAAGSGVDWAALGSHHGNTRNKDSERECM